MLDYEPFRETVPKSSNLVLCCGTDVYMGAEPEHTGGLDVIYPTPAEGAGFSLGIAIPIFAN